MAGRASSTQVMRMAGMDVELTRKRVKNINLRVRRDGTICVSAPLRVPLATIEAFVSSRRTWIEAAQQRVSERAARHDLAATDGALVMVWGEQLPLSVEMVPQAGRQPRCEVLASDGTITLRADERLTGESPQVTEVRERALAAWLRAEMRTRVEELLPGCEHIVGKKCSGVRLRAMTSRWGSCNVRSGMVTLNTQLVHYHPRCLEYVLFHELCHLWEPSHNERFHALMDCFMPAWREARAELDGRGI